MNPMVPMLINRPLTKTRRYIAAKTREKFSWNCILIFTLLFISSPVLAQLDPSSALLLKSNRRSGSSSVEESRRLDSSRYSTEEGRNVRSLEEIPVTKEDGFQVRVLPRDSSEVNSPKIVDPTQLKEQPPISSTSAEGLNLETESSTLQKESPSKVLRSNEPPVDGLEAKSSDVQNSDAQNDEEKIFPEDWEDQFIGGDRKELKVYMQSLHPQDIRRNKVEISLSTGYLYNNSKSAYWFRNYVTSGPTIEVQGSAWLSPFLGFQGSYLKTLSHSIKASPSDSNYLEAETNQFTVGLRGRRFFGLSRKSKYIIWGLDYLDYHTDIPATATERASIKSSGAKISFELNVPYTTIRSWNFGLELMPSLKHEEVKTSLNLKSGESVSSNAIGIWWGRKIVLSRKLQLSWKIYHRVEKNIFKGSANQIDPIRLQTPTGVDVTNSFTGLSLGVTWGN